MTTHTAAHVPERAAPARYAYRRLAVSEVAALNALYNACHQATNRPLAEAEWLFNANPNGPAVVLAAFDEGNDLVGVRPSLPWRFLWRGTERVAYEFADAMVATQHRNRGIFSRLVNQMCEFADQEDAILFTIPNGNSLPVYRRMPAMSLLGSCETRVKPISWPRYIGYRLGLDAHGDLNSAVPDPAPLLREGEVRLVPVKGFECSLEQIHAELGEIVAGFTLRSRDFLQWRYFGSPLRKYRVALIEQRGHIRGYLVIRMIHRVAHLIDIFMRPDPQLACKTFALLTAWAAHMGAIAIHFNASRGNFFHGIAAECGFWLKKTSGTLIVNRKSAGLFAGSEGPAEMANLYFVMGDFDFF